MKIAYDPATGHLGRATAGGASGGQMRQRTKPNWTVDRRSWNALG